MAARSGGNGDQGGMKCSLLPREFVSHSRSFAGRTLKLWLVDFSKPPNEILRLIVTPKRMKLSQKSSVPFAWVPGENCPAIFAAPRVCPIIDGDKIRGVPKRVHGEQSSSRHIK